MPDVTIVNVALPSIGHDLGAATSAVQWVVTGYGVAFAGLLILGGRAGDLLGRRLMFGLGLAVFALASLAAGLAQDLPLLVAARVPLGWSSPLVLGAVALAIATGACFVAAEGRHPTPLVRPRILLRPGLRNGATLAFLLGVTAAPVSASDSTTRTRTSTRAAR